jgi:glycosyltransferase involved in cell wall biosynthesis
MASLVVQLIEDEELRLRMGAEAAEDVSKRFELKRQAEEYLKWYDIISDIQEVIGYSA